MNRLLARAGTGAVLLSAVACTAGGGPSGTRTSPAHTASPRATTADRTRVVDASRTRPTAQLSDGDLPGPLGMSTAAVVVGRSAATFVRELMGGSLRHTASCR